MGYAVLAVLTGFCAVGWTSTGVRQWRGRGRPLSSWLGNGRFDAHALAGYDRGVLVVGVTSASFTVLLGGAAIFGLPEKSRPATGIAVYGADLAVLLVSVAAFSTIYYYNWPRFLVPPQLRHQAGVTAGRRRDRAERRAGQALPRPARPRRPRRPRPPRGSPSAPAPDPPGVVAPPAAELPAPPQP